MKRISLLLALPLSLFSLIGHSDSTSDVEVDHVKPFSSNAQQQSWNYMVGTWYGNQPNKDGGVREWLIKREPNGIYKVWFKAKGKKQLEVGEWGISGSVYFTIFKGWIHDNRYTPADETDPYNRDTYDVLKLTNEEFKYRHRSTGNEFTVKKVTDNFEFSKRSKEPTHNKSLKEGRRKAAPLN